MKIYIVTDLEGVSGVVEFEDRKDESPRNLALRQKYSRLLAGEVNAAIDGAFAGGATEVLVNDCHGGAYTIDFEMLDPRAWVIHGRQRPTWMVRVAEGEPFDAMFSIGVHAMAGTLGGVLYHSMSARIRQIRLNGKPIGELGLEAFCGGAYDVPLVLATGDVAACKEAEALVPNVVTVAVKEGLSRYAAISYPPARAREMICEGALQAMKRIKEVKPFVLEPPFTYEVDVYGEEGDVRASNPADLPDTWTTRDEIRADTAKELIQKVFDAEV